MVDQQSRIYNHQTRAAYRQAPAAIITSLFAGGLLIFILWDSTPHNRIFGAITGIIFVSLARLYLSILFKRKAPPDQQILMWGRLFLAGLFLQAVAWGGGGIVLFPDEAPLYQVIVTLWLVGLAGGAVAVYSVLRRGVLAFVIPVLAPGIVYLFSLGGRFHISLAMGVLGYMVVLVVATFRNHVSHIGSAKLVAALEAEIRERKKAERKLKDAYQETAMANGRHKAARNELSEMIDNLQDVFFRASVNGDITRTSPSVEDVFGYSQEEILRLKQHKLISDPDERQRFMAALKSSGGVVRNFEARVTRRDGQAIWISINAHYLHNELDEVTGVEGTARDVTERKRMEDKLREANEQARLANRHLEKAKTELEEMIDNLQDVFFRSNEKGEIIRTSPSVEDVFGYTQKEMEGKKTASLFALPEDMERFMESLRETEGVCRNFEALIRHKDGRTVWTATNAHYYYNDKNEPAGIEGTVRDITERKRMEEALLEISQKDGLTGLYNRRHFDETLEAELKRASRGRSPSPLSLILIDIDYFKPFNDTYGHQEGDDCLVQVGAALKKVVRRPGDLVARYGGEEMVIVLPNMDSKGAEQVAEQMRKRVKALRIPHEGSRCDEHVTISLGVATMYPEISSSAAAIIKKADEALYEAKEGGRNRVVISRSER